MNNRLLDIRNWPELAQKANWCAGTLAKQHGVSLRTLERFFVKNMGKSPKEWLSEQRHEEGHKMLKEGMSVKETAGNLGYEHFNNFSRDYKKHTGCRPTDKTTPQWAPNT